MKLFGTLIGFLFGKVSAPYENTAKKGPVEMIALFLLVLFVLSMAEGCSRKKEAIHLPEGEKGGEAFVSRLRESWTGDLGEILRQKRVVRVFVSYSYQEVCKDVWF